MIRFEKTEYVSSMTPIEHIVGDIPTFGYEADERPLKEQFNERYSFGGGWRPFEGFVFDKETKSLTYPGDPTYYPMARGSFRNQFVYVYQYGWVAIVEEDGSFEVSRMD